MGSEMCIRDRIETALAMAPGHGVSDTASSGGANALLVIIGIFFTFILGRFLLKKLSVFLKKNGYGSLDLSNYLNKVILLQLM